MENGIPVGGGGGVDGGENVGDGGDLGGAVVVVAAGRVVGPLGFESVLAGEREIAETKMGLC